ncbi:MAG: hypothetical protein OFPI_41270 [Osedax symbiont Rs2]|nr:MAG: hypothetical protein OFPI_41270 [Osedax symbiont Rs2]
MNVYSNKQDLCQKEYTINSTAYFYHLPIEDKMILNLRFFA